MSKRYELRLDGDEFRDMQRVAQQRGISVAELLRALWRERERRVVDGVISLAVGRGF